MSFISEDEFIKRFSKLQDTKVSENEITSHYVDSVHKDQIYQVRFFFMNNKNSLDEMVKKAQLINSINSPHFLKTYYFSTKENLNVPSSHPIHRSFSPIKSLYKLNSPDAAGGRMKSNKPKDDSFRYKLILVQDLPVTNLLEQINLRKHKGESFSFGEFRRITYCLIFALEKLEKLGYSLPLIKPSKIHMIDSLIKIDALQMVENQMKNSNRHALRASFIVDTRVNSIMKFEKYLSPEIQKLISENQTSKKSFSKQIFFNRSGVYSLAMVLLECFYFQMQSVHRIHELFESVRFPKFFSMIFESMTKHKNRDRVTFLDLKKYILSTNDELQVILKTSQELSQRAYMMFNERNFKESLLFEEEALELRRIANLDDPEVGNSLQKIGEIYRRLGVYSKAFDYFEEALMVKSRVLGEYHQHLASFLLYYASFCQEVFYYKQATKLFKQAIHIRLKLLGNSNIEYGAACRAIANCYFLNQKYEQAKSFINIALPIYRKNLPSMHLNLAEIHLEAGNIYQKLKEIRESLELYEKGLEIFMSIYSGQGVEVAHSLINLANVHRKLKSTNEASYLCKDALKLMDLSAYENKAVRAKALLVLGKVFVDVHLHQDAVRTLHEGLLLCRSSTTKGEIKAVEQKISKKLAKLYTYMLDYKNAIKMWKAAIDLRGFVGGSDKLYLGYLKELGTLYFKVKKFEKAKTVFSEGRDLCKSHGEANKNILKFFEKKINDAKNQEFGRKNDSWVEKSRRDLCK